MFRLRHAFSFVAVLLVALSAQAVTYIVPPDRDLVGQAEAIVIATGVASKSHYTRDGRLVTTATLRVEKSIAGDVAAGELLELTERGGQVLDRRLTIPGAPRYDAGARYLIFAITNTHGERATLSMGLGRFAFVKDEDGHEVLTRSVGDEPITGFVRGKSTAHVERLRDPQNFIAFVGETLQGKTSKIEYDLDPAHHRVISPEATRLFPRSNATRADYLLPGSPRWRNPTTTFQTRGAQPGFADGGRTAVQNSTVMWNAGSGNTNYSLGGTTTSTNGLNFFDEVSSILFNDPTGSVQKRRNDNNNPNIAAIGGTWNSADSQFSHTLDGQTFFDILGVDIEVGANLNISESLFQTIIAHEMGHTL